MDDTLLVVLVVLVTIALILLGILVTRRAARTSDAADRLGQIERQMQDRLDAVRDRVSGQVHDSLQASRIEQRESLAQAISTLESRFVGLAGQVDSKLTQTVQSNRQDMALVTERLAKLHEATGRVVGLSQSVHDLHALFKSPAGRGQFGEWTLERMLEEVLGNEGNIYRRQFTLRDGHRADVAVFTQPGGQQVVCVDSKFPSTNAQSLLVGETSAADRTAAAKAFRRDVLQHARNIAEKYVRPPETLDFAFMFVPSEAVFQLVLERRELHQRLLEMNVVPTSPNSFYAYLQVMAFGVRGMQIEAAALEIQKHVGDVSRDLETVSKSLNILGTHLRNAAGKYEETLSDMSRLSRRVGCMQSVGAEPVAEERPAEPVT
jgi:DNA recombination protein RmuC